MAHAPPQPPTIPQCNLFNPRYPHRHGPGRLQVSALSLEHPDLPPQVFRICIWCLHDFTQVMRSSGYHQIRVTAPEAAPLLPWNATR